MYFYGLYLIFLLFPNNETDVLFSTIVSKVGTSVQASKISTESADARQQAAMEAEAGFSGVNLDSEASALIEFQQAYQASARILTTAREMFQTLIDTMR